MLSISTLWTGLRIYSFCICIQKLKLEQFETFFNVSNLLIEHIHISTVIIRETHIFKEMSGRFRLGKQEVKSNYFMYNRGHKPGGNSFKFVIKLYREA